MSPFSQDQENSEKYWGYRDRLKKNFLKIGNLPGESIPMSARAIGYCYDQAPLIDGRKPSRIYYGDATIYLGHYLIVLATEYQNLMLNDQETLPTLVELYYAIAAINRLDLHAENYLSNEVNTITPDDRNGFILRDDVPLDFYTHFEGDYSQNLIRPANIIKSQSDYDPLNTYSDDNYIGYNWSQHTEVVDPDQHNQNGVKVTNYMSLDQITTLFTGLRCVYDLVDGQTIQPTSSDSPMNLKNEAKAIVHRILDYVVREETVPGNDPGYSFTIRDPNGRMDRAGSDLSGDAPFLFGIGRHFNYPLFNSWVSDGLSNILVAIMVDSPTLKQKVVDTDFYFVCKNELIDRLDEKGYEPINVATIPLDQLLILIDEIEEQSTEYISGNEILCINFTNELANAWQNLDLNVQGMLCDNIGIELNGYAAAVAPLIVASLVPLAAPLLVGTVLAIESVVGVVAAFTLTPILIGGWLYLTMAEPEFCLTNITDDESPLQALSEDNVHILQELATISGRWSPEYVNSIDHPSGLDYYTMLRGVLEPNGTAKSLLNSTYLEEHFLNTAPCMGPYADPNSSDCAPNLWASQNRLFHAMNAELGPDAAEFRGEFSGLDYMVYYNLYSLLWPENTASYERSLSCQCIEEITFSEEFLEPFVIKPKFEDYKVKGIPIESYLAHNLTFTSTSGILEVKNDFIICRENQNELPTELTITDGAEMNLYSGNTITVRKGNILRITNGSTLRVGYADNAADYAYTEIILEENAKLIVEDGSSLISYGHCRLTMKEGSQFVLEDSECTPANEDCRGLSFDTFRSDIAITNSLFVTHQFQILGHQVSSFVETVFIADNSEVKFSSTTPTLSYATTGGSWFEFRGNSTFQVSMPFTHNAGNIAFREDSHLLIEDGDLIIQNNCHMQWQSSDCRINTTESRLVFEGGHLVIPNNHTFAFTYDNSDHGYVEILPGSENVLDNGVNSMFFLSGLGPDDLILKINHHAHLQILEEFQRNHDRNYHT